MYVLINKLPITKPSNSCCLHLCKYSSLIHVWASTAALLQGLLGILTKQTKPTLLGNFPCSA